MLVSTDKDPLDGAHQSTRNQQIQADMTYRALELLNLPPDQPAFLLDIGCGSGLSGEILDEEGYIWAGVDIAPSMLGESIYELDAPRVDNSTPQMQR